MSIRSSVLLLMLCTGWAQAQDSHRDFEIADSLVKRLPPSAFPQLPLNIRVTLEQGGFTVPQTWEDSLPHNVIQGHFRTMGQIDWAVLASQNRVSCILIFWNASATDTTHLEQQADGEYLQGMGEYGIVFSRQIGTSSFGELTSDCGYDGATPVRTDHEAIEDFFLGKASTLLYLYKAQWYQCPGAD